MSIIRRIEPDPLSRGAQHRIVRIRRLFYKADNTRERAGHIRLFADRPGKGWCVYHYNQLNERWALHRVWNFGLFAIHHVGPGDSCDEPGWHITRASLTLERSHRAITLKWRLADTYRTKGGIRLRDIRRHRVLGTT